ncbi:MAG: molybdenum cofactor synthesis protein [Bacteroidia bacterium]|nr:molybdenum cofactor synthesis protein [Bacteroidia bacterium]
MQKIKIISVNLSEKTGTIKNPANSISLNNKGVKGDAHAGTWHRQVSLLGKESIEKFEALAGRKFQCGEFAENITTQGMILYQTTPLDRFYNENIELEVTQIGKQCHGDVCAIFREVGNCIMPKEGIFCRVIRSGKLKTGDELEYHPKVFRTVIITLSDRASSGEYSDRSGPKIKELLESYFIEKKKLYEIENILLPDDARKLKTYIHKALKQKVDFIFTTGGTGIGQRDITPDIIRPLIEKEIPGIMEMIRIKYGQEKPNALLSRSIAGVSGKTQIYTLPGSVKAVNEYMNEICKTLEHIVFMLYGLDIH